MRTFQGKRVCVALFVVAFSLLVAASSGRADTLFTNLGPGQSYGIGFYTPGLGGTVIAGSFVASASETLADALLVVANTTNPLIVYVESDAAGAPGAILDTLTQVGKAGTTPSVEEFTCSACPQLVSGTGYFLAASELTAGATADWYLSSSDSGKLFFDFNGSATGPWLSNSLDIPAFEIDGAPTTTPDPSNAAPEPSSRLLLGAGLLGLLVVRGKFAPRRNGAA